ncbi:type VI secretion system Vgr family protein [Pseudoduganella armeniaca]|uniref:Type VI secretion system tip protein VgrG n=1 Tax=Pseudoduganella armeniaca TaxID=2072590 RepID=A0A2R4C4D5_9BURK|nr:type VI secretion system Vgr family protein [Pseudoduganella armeniaca]AVR94465.1 type VI secretion system tip protein VgrG [Pseudoduganella armeniaca]
MSNPTRFLNDLMYGRQYNRILRLSFPHGDAPPHQFVVNKLDAVESLSRDFEYKVELLCDSAGVLLEDVQGKLLNITLVRTDGTERYFSGYVFSFRRRQSEGNITIYQAELGPWFRFLSLRRNSFLFHEKTLRDQTEEILQTYGAYPKWEWRVTDDDPVMTDACQYDETDFNYLSRRWEEKGWCYWYEHDAQGHTLIVSSDSTAAAPVDGGGTVRFHAKGGAVEEDAIDTWSPSRQGVPAGVTLAAFDFKAPTPVEVGTLTLAELGSFPRIETYEYTGAYGFGSRAAGDGQARVRMEEFEASAAQAAGEGNCRFIQPGRWFHLTADFDFAAYLGASDAGGDEFFVISARHSAANNYLSTEGGNGTYRNWFTCAMRTAPWRPGRGHNSVHTKILALQTATVVGPEGNESIHTDQYGRVRVQFHWDRVGTQDDRSSAWVRVSSAWAGAELGASMVPRVGTEVIVQWLGGNPDRPIITGALYNERNMPPWAVPGQQALSGLRSRELAPGKGNSPMGRSNHLVLDDTNEQIQAQLRSDHLHSQLSLGFLTRIDDTQGRRDARGEGWELRTDGHGVLRAGAGLLVTTDARSNGVSHAKDLDETTQRLATAVDLHEGLLSAATQHDDQPEEEKDGPAEAARSQQETIRASGKEPFSELSAPHLVLGSPAGIALNSAKSAHIASAEHIALSSGKSLSIASAASMFASIGKSLRLFVHKAGLSLIAAAGKVTVRAQANDVEVIANKVLELMSESDWVEIRGKKGIRLHGANHMLEISDQTQFFTTSPVLFHGNLETLGAKSVAQAFNEKHVDLRFDQEVFLMDANGEPMKDVAYELIRDDGTIITGKTGPDGSTGLQKGNGLEGYTIRWKGEMP